MTKRRIALGALVTVILAVIFFIANPGGAAKAAALLTGMDIKDQSLSSYDLGPDSVGTSELKDDSTFFKNLSPGTRDLINSKASKTQAQSFADQAEIDAKGHANVVADSAENAAKGYADANDGVGFNESRAGAGYTQTVPANSIGVVYGKCPEARPLAISGGYRLNGWAAESFSGSSQPRVDDVLVLATEPAAYDAATNSLVNSYQNPAFPQTPGGSFQANAWATTIQNDSDNELQVRAWATCVALD